MFVLLEEVDEMLLRAAGLQEPNLRSMKTDVRPENANRKLERTDLRLRTDGFRLESSEALFET